MLESIHRDVVRTALAIPLCLLAAGTFSARAEDGMEHWAFQPLQVAAAPDVQQSTWPIAPIDRFILARLEAAELTPAADAPPAVLARRLYFDLSGLPPTPEQLDRFRTAYEEEGQAAIAALVDQLLASPHFGERWGRHWLDLVRYAETNGGDRNVIWPHAWRYRDYVIEAFNADRPFDQFVREQIAGDLLPASTPEQRDRQLIATGMLTLGPKLFMETDAERFRMDVVDEQIDVIGQAVLGLTISCARCHDHKFDPISTAEYYSLAGIFRSTYLLYGTAAPAGNQYGHDRPLQPVGENAEQLHGPAELWKQDVATRTAERNKARSDRYRVVRKKAAQENMLAMLSNGKSEQQQAEDAEVQALQAEIEQLAAEIAEWDEKIKQLDEQLQQTVDNPPPMPDYAMSVRDAEDVGDCRICIRGQHHELGEAAPRGFLAAVPHSSVEIPPGRSGRLQLAHWLTDAQNPLTARVLVNRVWHHLYGQGLVRTVNNFGVLGEQPSHPELLDYLAGEFQRDGWSVKRLIRRIVLSRTYQMDSRHELTAYVSDPENRLLWHMNRRRLDAEALRDALLAVSGQLDRRRPDGSVISREFAKEAELNAQVALTAEQLEDRVRSVYLPVARMSLPGSLRIWNFADPCLAIGDRSDRPTAEQQLFFLNSKLVIQQTRAIAERLVAEQPDDAERMHQAWLLLLGRQPTSDERQLASSYMETCRGEGLDEIGCWSMLCQGLLASADFRYID